MDKYSIGFRMKFDDIELEDIGKVIADYLKNFERYEIKVTKKLISSGKIVTLLNVSENLATGKYSLHLPKALLASTQSYAEIITLINILKHYKSTNKVYLLTHIPNDDFQEYLKNVLNIIRDLPENYILLLENEMLDSDNDKYLCKIDQLCTTLCKEKITNIGVCLDLGHLLFGFYKEGKSEEYALAQLRKMPYLISIIRQIHIHDYCKTDHLQLGQGLMNLEKVSKFIVENDLIVPIIIETTVKQPEQDGIKQVLVMSQSLKSFKEMNE